MKKLAVCLLTCLLLLAAVCVFADDNSREAFLHAMKVGLEERQNLAGADEINMTPEQFVEYRTSLVDVELSQIEQYREAVFEDERFELLAKGYIDAVGIQKGALAYYQDLPALYDIEWGAGYNARAVIIADLYENYGLGISPEVAQSFIDAKNSLYSYSIVTDSSTSSSDSNDDIIKIESKTAEYKKHEYGGWKVSYKVRNLSDSPIIYPSLNFTVCDAAGDIIVNFSNTSQATVNPDQAITIDVLVQNDEADSIKVESFSYTDESGTYRTGSCTDEKLELHEDSVQSQEQSEGVSSQDDVTIVAENEAEEDEPSPATDFLYATNNGEAVIRSYKGNASKVVIPYEIDGNVVTTIAEKAFYKNEAINSVTLPAGVVRVGDSAFSHCSNLSELKFPKEKMGNLVIEHEGFYNIPITGSLVICADSLQLGPNAFAVDKLDSVILYCDKILFEDKPFCYNPIQTFYMNPDADIAYDGHYSNSETGDAFAKMEVLEEIYLPSSCSFLTENSFVETPMVTLYGEEGASWLKDAENLWMPVSTQGYAEKTKEVEIYLEQAGYHLTGDVSALENTANEDPGGKESNSGETAEPSYTIEPSVEQDNSNINICLADGCNKEGTHAVIGLAGNTEWYCDEHYQEMIDILNMMEESVSVTGGQSFYGKTATGDTGKSSSVTAYDAYLEYGSGDVAVFSSEDAMKRYMSALANDYQGTVSEMLQSGEVAYTPKGTKCNIVKRQFSKAQVKLLEGNYAGNTVWVVIEALQEQ